MENNLNSNESVFVDSSQDYDKQIKSIPKPAPTIGIDTDGEFLDDIIDAGETSQLDATALNKFTRVSQQRNELYNILDIMCEDAMIAAAIETYAEDVTEQNDKGDIIWVESSDAKIAKYVQFLIDSLNINKNIYKWAYALCKYGDIYVRLYRKSDINIDIFNKDKKNLNEDVKIKAYSNQDKYAQYIAMEPNPAEMFELTRFGKTCGYIKAPTSAMKTDQNNILFTQYNYSFNQNDILVYEATEYVHGALEDNTNRTPETVEIFLNNDKESTDGISASYTVKRGQSLLYNLFKNWRELQLLETSVLLNRLTKSSISRVINVQVGDMPKEKVLTHLRHIKSLFEQKTSLTNKFSMTEYNNPGPIENNVYIPVRTNGQGSITAQTMGGDVDVKSLADLEYYRDKLFGGLRIPKQYLGFTDDATGFNGGTSLTLISSRYAKAIKRIQSVLTQVVTDVINLYLIDRGLVKYVNNFTIKMTTPASQEEVDRQDIISKKIDTVSSIMNLIGDIENPVAKIKILKEILTGITDSEVLNILQEEIKKLEKDAENELIDNEEFSEDNDKNFNDDSNISKDISNLTKSIDNLQDKTPEETEDNIEISDTEELPTPGDLGQNFTDTAEFIQ